MPASQELPPPVQPSQDVRHPPPTEQQDGVGGSISETPPPGSFPSGSVHSERSVPPVRLSKLITEPLERRPNTIVDTPTAFDGDTPVAMVLPTPVTARPRGSTLVAGQSRYGFPEQGPQRSMSGSVYEATKDMASDYEARRFMGSAGMGTSALVSAVTALPWDQDNESTTDDDGDVDTDSEDGHTPLPADMTQSAYTQPQRPKLPRLHSSLHTIRIMDSPLNEKQPPLPSPQPHRERASPWSPSESTTTTPATPSGRSRHHVFSRHSLDFPFKENVITRRAQEPRPNELSYQFAPPGNEEDTGPPPRVGSTATLRPGIASELADSPSGYSSSPAAASAVAQQPGMSSTTEDLAHEKRARMQKLGTLLQEVFGLEKQEDVIEELPCWLLRSDMLKGYMFLTRDHICFFAHMPEGEENQAIKSGPLWKKNSRTKLHTRFWFVLRNDVLSWYESAQDPYFPKGNVSLQYASSCDMTGTTKFKLRTSERNYTFQSDSEDNAAEWVRVIRKVISKTQNEGESIKVIIPWEAVVEVERSPTLEFAETIEIKVVDSDDSMSVDSYFFASFPDNDYAFEILQTLLRERPVTRLPSVTPQPRDEEAHQEAVRQGSAPQLSFPRLGSVLRPFNSEQTPDSRVPIAAPTAPSLPQQSLGDSQISEGHQSQQLDDSGYPPQQQGPPPPGMAQNAPAGWSSEWIRKPASKIFGTSPPDAPAPRPRPRRSARRKNSVAEVVEPFDLSTEDESEAETRKSSLSQQPSSTRRSRTSFGAKLLNSHSDYSMASDAGEEEEDEVVHKFHTYFALPEKEVLLDHFSGSLYRVLPVHGTFYISENYFCFKSTSLLNKTRMIVPVSQLFGMKAQKAFRFAHHGLVVIVKGQEELFLEFHSSKRRDACQILLEERMDAYREKTEAARALQAAVPEEPRSDEVSELTPPEMFNSASSSFLQFKPEPMRITCLTIGSRGDVQPYIALCKGLKAEGHTCTIATHSEYKNWVEGHGIGFAAVGGDPAKLMELCVDNGMFSMSFIKEGLQQGWLDDLLNDSWRACQGAELLIESPSAMAGIHVAEALQIPYYRAFTMPWTRTRAYPQAFAVPDQKRGGTYNYMTYVIFDQVFWRAISGQVNRWRKNVLGIESTTLDKLEQDKVPFLYNFSPKIVPPPVDWTEWIHVTGYWFLDNADSAEKSKNWAPPDGLEEFIAGARSRGQKIVYIGFGSIVVSDPQEMTRCVVQAVVDSGVCAILSKGWSDRGSRGGPQQKEASDKSGADGIQYPPEIFSVDAIDHGWLFPRIDAACHHGGAGTTGASLRAGIPTIIKPFFGDQMFWAERMDSLGVGSAIRKLTAETLAEALKAATTNERQIAKAKVVGEALRQEDGVQRAIQSIYRDLEYAKSLIKPPPAKSNPLDKVVSASLQSLRSSGSIRSSSSSIKEGQDGRHSREPSGDHGAISDESWSVVSDSGRDKSISSASRSFAISGQDSDAPSDSDYDSDRKGSKRRSLVGLFGNLTHRLSRDEK